GGSRRLEGGRGCSRLATTGGRAVAAAAAAAAAGRGPGLAGDRRGDRLAITVGRHRPVLTPASAAATATAAAAAGGFTGGRGRAIGGDRRQRLAVGSEDHRRRRGDVAGTPTAPASTAAALAG